ncbi:MAG: cation diffusion facilitator family transporter [Pseudomonadota bacterium]|nr:cation diffusion facilitator family transporter [Pseudomonadota bacterium]
MSAHHHHSTDNIKIAFFLNLSFTIIELIGGVFTHSTAILSDALHDLGDSVTLGLSWYLAQVSEQEKDQKFSYGYQRFSLLGALISSLILLIGSVIILIEALPRLMQPETVYVEGMVVLALLGVSVNGFSAWRLRSGKTQNERVVMLHLLEDVLGWLAVLIVSLLMLFVYLPILDPLLAIVITSYILWQVFKNLKETSTIFLQATPVTLSPEQLKTVLLEQFDIISVHDIHIWSLDGVHNVLSLHIVIDNHLSQKEFITIKNQVRQFLTQYYHIHHSTIEIEYEKEYCDLAHS